ncbi:MAG: hypothetical protein JNL25_05590, partial [Rhodospirillaceae bacterium]|nr:hypothetical protein [Rhodospirillaceae bacterium]
TLEPELGQLVEQKGWRSPSDVLSSYRHLERLVGAERIVLPAPDAEPAQWGLLWDRLGRPKDPGGYALKAPAGGGYDAATAAWFREAAHEAGLTAKQAAALHDGFLARFPAVEAATPHDSAASPPPEEALRDLWGRKYESNMTAARRAFAAFLGEEAPFHDIADALGETALMEMLAKIGRLIGEDSITARAESGAGPRNPAEALAEIARLRRAIEADSGHPYLTKTHPEHQNLVRKMEALYALAYGGS